MKSMTTHYFDDYESFVCEASDMYDSIKDDFKAVTIVAKYEEAKEILKELICIDMTLHILNFVTNYLMIIMTNILLL